MTLKLLKTQTENELLIERVMYTRRYSLVLDRRRCVGCKICQAVCPKEAIEIVKPTKTGGKILGQPSIMIDKTKCHFCGICGAICPFGAFALRINGANLIPVLEKESFPRLIREINVDETRCPIDCKACEESCPFNLVKVTADKIECKVSVYIDKEHCPCCRLCEVECPYDALQVRKTISGSIRVHYEKCPDGCRDCVDVCPVPGVLHLLGNGKVEISDFCCIYCGVCEIVCPIQGALEVHRSSVYHTPVKSGAWNKALEKLTSTQEMAKELRSKLATKARESVKRRFS